MYAIRSYYALFNKDLTEFVESYDGRMQEPVRLPAKVPLLLLQGAEGIAVGMATKIMPHNVITSYSIHYTKLYDPPIKTWKPACKTTIFARTSITASMCFLSPCRP